MPPRPRNRKNADLPANLYLDARRGTYQYRRPDNGRKTGMGSDKAAAIRAARTLNGILSGKTDLVRNVISEVPTVSGFLFTYFTEILPPRELARATLDLYQVRRRQVEAAFGDRPIDEVVLRDIAQLLDSMRPRGSNQTRALLCDVFQQAAAKGYVPDNPAALTIPKAEQKARKRHTLDGLMQIRSASPGWLRNAIDLALITAQRRDDILAMRFDDIRDGHLHVIQSKTKKSSDAGYLRMAMTPQLRSVVDRCRDNVPSPFLIHRKPDRLDAKQRATKDHWTSIEGRYLTRAFQAARAAANPYPRLTAEQQPGFHEIRALAQHLYKKAGRDPQRIAGHATAAMTKNYLADHSDIIWTDVEPDIQIPGITG